jgi:hypothetical protein
MEKRSAREKYPDENESRLKTLESEEKQRLLTGTF